MLKFKTIKTIIIVLLFVTTAKAQLVNDLSWRNLIYKSSPTWYASDEAKAIAENVLLYQRDNGCWPKNILMHLPLSEKEKKELMASKSTVKDCTIDNGATSQEMIFLSKLYQQNPDERYKKAFLSGLNYLLEAQYENGGWPQFYPLKKGYSSHITYNDDAMINVLNLLKDINVQNKPISIQPSDELLQKIEIAINKGIDCILKTQYLQNGILTSWCAQHNEFTLLPEAARSFELASLSGGESAKIVLFLMAIENPSNKVITAVNNAVAWFEKTKITNLKEELIVDENGKVIEKIMIPSQNEKPIWARFMELENNKPIFCDRDGIKKETIAEISLERRLGYAWYVNAPQKVLDTYEKWKLKNVIKKPKDETNLVVALDESGDFTSIQEAIDQSKAFPDERITIFIKNGIYKEKIKIHEWNTNITLLGESKEKTIITFDDYFNKMGLGRNSTFYTYTLLVQADDTVLKNLTIENSSGEIGQAVALSVTSNRVGVINCNLLGNQDTLYATGTGKQYYKACYIEGTTDFIFGSATAFFENCQIHSKKDSYITAASTPKDTHFGYVFKNCRLTAAEQITKVYLGRPWRNHAKTVFLNCELGSHILPEGWHNWSKPEAEKTTFYAEYNNNGKGAATNLRVKWAQQLTKKQIKKYTLKNILADESTNPFWYAKL
ncbi:pectate lyase [Flavobacterium sp. UBA6135]|uniref:pectate lyase n=1 Tax=Flavobacterium sp. UBA6135 TaxID=1946553 RepID=UPI0025BB3B2B|nr:pectate lyase [Flavobacterium sp. UBA6135]